MTREQARCPGNKFYPTQTGDSTPCRSPEPLLMSLFPLNLKPSLHPAPYSLYHRGRSYTSGYTLILFRQQCHQLLIHFSCQNPYWSKNCSISSPVSHCKHGTLLDSCNILISSKEFAIQYICPLECLNSCHSCPLSQSHGSCGAMHNRCLS